MVYSLKAQLEQVIADIVNLAQELDQLRGWDIERSLGLPASPRQIEQVQGWAGFPLPDDYRCFLELHNGWYGFSGEHHILSAEQMNSEAMRASIEETREIQRESGDAAAGGFVVLASESGSDIAYIDPGTRRSDGTADVVQWDPRMREYRRHPSFLAYLESHKELLQRRIEKERNRGFFK